MIGRRQFLSMAALGGGAIWVSSHMALASADTDRRFVFIIQRGAADGLDIVRPYGDRAFAALRGSFAGDPGEGLALDGFFRLHPALPGLGEMYARGEALFVHAVASPYRNRSHFDGQNVLETGGAEPYQIRDGWLNRLVGLMPKTGNAGIALASTMPMAMRGVAPVTSYVPSTLPGANDDLTARVAMLYDKDPELHMLWAEAVHAEELANGLKAKQNPASLGQLAANFLSRNDGPRIAMIETSGWDTHSGQAPRLASNLKGLDTLICALRDHLKATWAKTTVVVATEFGRTAAINGTGGTDHGTASAAMILGGGVIGGRVISDWPGLAQRHLYEERDLRPTLALDALIAGVAGEALQLDPDEVGRKLFSTAIADRPVTGLVRI